MQIPPFVGAYISSDMSFENRVHWYAIWIKAYPMSSIHIQFTDRRTGFIIEARR
jgi:hypothetical protein